MFRAFCVVSVLLITGTQAVSADLPRRKGPPTRTPTCITAKIWSLPADYNPVYDEHRKDPTASQQNATQSEKNLIDGAFNVAPDKLKTELCKVDAIFSWKGNYNWGFSADPSASKENPPLSGTFIGIRSSDLASTTLTVATLEDELEAGANVPVGYLKSHNQVNTADDHVAAILSILAHEVGHIKWHRDKLWDLTCNGGEKFSDFSWNTLTSTPGNRWTKLGLDTLEDHKSGLPPKPRKFNNANDLKRIYREGFATALAADTPEEDFVETYKLTVLSVYSVTKNSNLRIEHTKNTADSHEQDKLLENPRSNHVNNALSDKIDCVAKVN